MARSVFTIAAIIATVSVGIAIAGAPPQAPSQVGCHGRQQVAYVPLQESGCHGQRTMLAPAVTSAGCHGGSYGGSRLTFSERRLARKAARANYYTTLNQFRDAGRRGLVSSVPVEAAPTYEAVPVVE